MKASLNFTMRTYTETTRTVVKAMRTGTSIMTRLTCSFSRSRHSRNSVRAHCSVLRSTMAATEIGRMRMTLAVRTVMTACLGVILSLYSAFQ